MENILKQGDYVLTREQAARLKQQGQLVPGAMYYVRDDVFIAQMTTMPTATAELVNTIYQYIGQTTPLYTNGYFYKCVADGSSYVWTRVDTQPIGLNVRVIE